MNAAHALALAAAGAAAGAINSVAGGGTLISFPAAMAVGLPPLVANATNAVALVPGSIASAWGYRRELAKDAAVVRAFAPPMLLGGLGGAALLLATPARVFDAIVPALVLFATLLFAAQNLRRPTPASADAVAWELPRRPLVALAAQFAVGLYCGYFGAGQGMMMLALLASVGGRDVHRMNGVKNVLAALGNAVAGVVFAASGAIDARAAAVLAVGAIAGGWGGAALARRVNPRLVRWCVVALGLLLAGSLAARRLSAR